VDCIPEEILEELKRTNKLLEKMLRQLEETNMRFREYKAVIAYLQKFEKLLSRSKGDR